MSFKIVPLEYNHIDNAVDVHIKAFPDFFLTFLGPSFLKQFYKSFLEDEQGIGFIAIEDNTNNVLGIIVGPLNPAGYFKRLLKRRWYAFCLASLKAVLKKPSTIKRLFQAVFYRGDGSSDTNRSLLSSIAVSPETQGQGVGKALVQAWLNEIKQRGSSSAFLTTDSDNNDTVNAFYQNLGWKTETTYTTPQGRNMNRYVYDFEDKD